MANTKKKKKLTTTAAKASKKADAAAAKTVESVMEKKEPVKEEVKKLTAKEEPKKIAAAKEPEKIAAKEEPKKLTVKEEAGKKEADAKAKAEKKSTAKKAVKTAAEKEEKPVKKTTRKAAAKKEAGEKKEEPKKAAVKKTTKKAKLAAYESWSLEECIAKMQEMQVHHRYEDYARFLMDEANIKTIEKNIIEGNGLEQAAYDFDKDGFDKELVAVTLKKVADTMDIKAMDYKEIQKDMKECAAFVMGEDAEANAAEYLKEFKVCEKLLMIGQRKGISSAEELGELIGGDVDAFVSHFFQLAYDILPTWQYDDVKFYEDFAFAVLSQYQDLFAKYQLNILLDVADLYIKHGDFQHGDECYGYILRDNQIKDYIYYRFASVYEPIDFNKAKGLAYESLQYVDGRYTYYQNIMDIINK